VKRTAVLVGLPHLVLEVDDLLHALGGDLPLCAHQPLPLVRAAVEEARVHLRQVISMACRVMWRN